MGARGVWRTLGVFFALGLIVGLLAFSLYEYRLAQHLRNLSVSLQNQVAGIQNQVTALAKASTTKSVSLASAVTTSTPTVTSAVARVTPAVVSIVISAPVPQTSVSYESFGNFLIPVIRHGESRIQKVGAGSGFLIKSDGYIMTNKHVVIDPSATYTVTLASGKELPATVVYTDPKSDIAIMKIAGSGYPVASFRDSSSLALGQTVIAIGNALGEYSNSVSVGIVSGLGRSVEAQDEMGNTEKLTGVIQTDAAVNPGNSGGPLVDLEGYVIGVTVADIVGSNSIAFAIPSSVASAIASRVL